MKPLRSTLFLPALILFAALPVCAQQAVPAAPVPAPIFSAQKVFVANAGLDALSQEIYGHFTLQPTEAYDALYAGLKSWGRYQVVGTPGDADLVFEIRGVEQQAGCGVGTEVLQIVLTIYDAKSHFLLWKLTQPIQLANRAETWRKNIAAANDNLIAQLRSLLMPAAPAHP